MGCFSSSWVAFLGAAQPGAHLAEVLEVLDGDTFDARVHVWPGLDITIRVRLRGIDAPEPKGA
jgi:endonuclease YncB( thermonuclease family)